MRHTATFGLSTLVMMAGCGEPAKQPADQSTNKPAVIDVQVTEDASDHAADSATSDDLVKAEVGVGKKGRGYGGGMITEPIRAKFRAEQKIVFDIQIPSAMRTFEGLNGRKPMSHEEFMEKIIEENLIVLPELPEGEEYVYDPEAGELMVRRPK